MVSLPSSATLGLLLLVTALIAPVQPPGTTQTTLGLWWTASVKLGEWGTGQLTTTLLLGRKAHIMKNKVWSKIKAPTWVCSVHVCVYLCSYQQCCMFCACSLCCIMRSGLAKFSGTLPSLVSMCCMASPTWGFGQEEARRGGVVKCTSSIRHKDIQCSIVQRSLPALDGLEPWPVGVPAPRPYPEDHNTD